MSRPPFSLSDQEARALVQQLGELNLRHPLDRRDHRPFVRDFLRAVHRATGRTFSPLIYRRLLAAYAPERRPSTATLALEKETLVAELGLADLAARELAAAPHEGLGELVRHAVADALGRHAPARGRTGAEDSYAVAQCTFLQARLADAEAALQEARAHAARLAAELQATRAAGLAQLGELEAARSTIAAQADALGRLAPALEDSRQFAMRAIDAARGETRTVDSAWKKSYEQLELKFREDRLLLETFRQLAYQKGAAIPPALRSGETK